MKKVFLCLLSCLLCFVLVGCNEKEEETVKEEVKNKEQVICNEENTDQYGTFVKVRYVYNIGTEGNVDSTNIFLEYTIDKNIYDSWPNKSEEMDRYTRETKANVVSMLFGNAKVDESYYKIDSDIKENVLSLDVSIYNFISENKTSKENVLNSIGKRIQCEVKTVED